MSTKRRNLIFITGAVLALAQQIAASTLFEWTGPYGNWSEGIFWNNCVGTCSPPNSPLDDVSLDNATSVNEDLTKVSIRTLIVWRGSTLGISAGNNLTAIQVTGNTRIGIGDGASLTIGPGLVGLPAELDGLQVSVQSSGRVTQLQLADGAVVKPAASIVLNSLNDHVSGIGGAESVTNRGTITGPGEISTMAALLNQGTIDVASITVASLDNTLGTLTAGVGEQLLTSSNLINYNAGTLRGGVYDTAGRIQLAGLISTLDPGTTIRLRGAGSIADPTGTNALSSLTTNKGSILATAGSNAPLGAASLLNLGQIVIDQGSTLTVGDITNQGGALIQVGGVTGGFLQASSVLNKDLVEVFGGSSLLANFDPSGTGIFGNATGGEVVLGGGSGTASIVANQTVVVDGTVTVLSNGRLQEPDYKQIGGLLKLQGGHVLNATAEIVGGTVQGFGAFNEDVNNSGGTLIVEGGYLSVDGSLTEGMSASLTENLTSGFDLVVGVDATIDGTFTGTAAIGKTFAAGDSFEIIRCLGKLSGNFATYNLPILAPGLVWKTVIDAQSIHLTVAAM